LKLKMICFQPCGMRGQDCKITKSYRFLQSCNLGKDSVQFLPCTTVLTSLRLNALRRLRYSPSDCEGSWLLSLSPIQRARSRPDG
jgi:hypothetical protein